MGDAGSAELKRRGSIIDVVAYDVLVDLTTGPDRFWSRTELTFRCRAMGASTFADVEPVELGRVVLNGVDLTTADLHRDGRLDLPRLAEDNHLVVEAEFAYAEDGRGLIRVAAAVDGAGDGVYSKANNGGASRTFCCFDQPDLRAPISLSVRAPSRWCCRANSPAVSDPTDGGEASGGSPRHHSWPPTCLLCVPDRIGEISVPHQSRQLCRYR